jgi:dienelactone hydrolase
MVVGVDWVLEQNEDPSSEMYHRIDATHIGATGHSQGGFATTQAAGDSRITSMVPLCGAMAQRNLTGSAMIFCGGADDTVPCTSVEGAFTAITTQPAMLAEYVTADHANWLTFFGNNLTEVETAVTAWMRVHLMEDIDLRSWFYGPSCALCTDSAWQITQKNMDE